MCGPVVARNEVMCYLNFGIHTGTCFLVFLQIISDFNFSMFSTFVTAELFLCDICCSFFFSSTLHIIIYTHLPSLPLKCCTLLLAYIISPTSFLSQTCQSWKKYNSCSPKLCKTFVSMMRAFVCPSFSSST